MAVLTHDFDRKAHRGIRLEVVRSAVAVGRHFGVVELGEILAEIGVGREAVVTAIDLGDGERDALACRRW